MAVKKVIQAKWLGQIVFTLAQPQIMDLEDITLMGLEEVPGEMDVIQFLAPMQVLEAAGVPKHSIQVMDLEMLEMGLLI